MSATARSLQRSNGLHTAQQQCRRSVVVRASSSELKRPELKRPELQPQPQRKLFEEEGSAAPTAASAPVEATVASPSKVVTVEFQRQRAKEMNKYFQNVKLQQQLQSSKVFGWTPANEINNGRWVMFGLAVGMLTEYATGVSFTEQFGLIVSYLGIADLD